LELLVPGNGRFESIFEACRWPGATKPWGTQLTSRAVDRLNQQVAEKRLFNGRATCVKTAFMIGDDFQ